MGRTLVDSISRNKNHLRWKFKLKRPEMRDFKCLAIDIDGTITEEGNYINPDIPGLLKSLEDVGIKVVFVTGRSIWEVYALAAIFGTTRVGVAENGGAVVYNSPLDVYLLGDITEPLMTYERLAQLMPEVELYRGFPRLTEVVLKRTIDVKKANEIIRREGFRTKVVDSGFALHIVMDYVDKGRGLLKACELLNVDARDVVAIGDSDPDVEMFKVAGFSVAVANATEAAKAEADLVTKQPRGRGVAEAISYIFERFT